MSRIHRLPPELANQIAAGEVVERPASVVKELVENAIDARASRITIAIEFGGKRLIRIEDDGEGMTREEAELALERHATSKIRTAADLVAIATLGFRGEALPSIGSVSHLTLRTRTRGTASGTEIRINAGTTASVREVGAAEGTVVEVADLFYNLPARRKFLKSDAAESAQVSRLVTQLALAYPEVGFALTSAGRKVLQCPPVASLRQRFVQLYGERPDLVEVERVTAGVSIRGLVAALGEQEPARGPQNVFVNRRIVKDKTIAHAVTAAYAVATVKERSPEVHLFLELPADRVDVNVHPTKAEVRFLEQSLVHELIRRAIGDALGRSASPELQLQLSNPRAAPGDAIAPAIPGILAGAVATPRWAPDAGVFPRAAGTAAGPGARAGLDTSAVPQEGTGLTGTLGENSGAPSHDSPGGVDASHPMPAVRPMTPLGQFRDTYIIAVDEEGIAIVDQHVAHERVLFERVMERLGQGRLPSQRLLAPVLVDLAASQRAAVVAHHDDLDRLGYEIEEFGGKSVRITAVPALLGIGEAADAVRALAEDLEGLDRGARVDDALRRVAATTACHAAVKANDPLTFEKMAHILEELRRTAYSTVCPHGRPVVLRLTRREIEKNFQRI